MFFCFFDINVFVFLVKNVFVFLVINVHQWAINVHELFFWMSINNPLSGLGWRMKQCFDINVFVFWGQKCPSMSHKSKSFFSCMIFHSNLMQNIFADFEPPTEWGEVSAWNIADSILQEMVCMLYAELCDWWKAK